MYSYEDRLKAVNLYIKYDLSAADTVRELGYPNYKMLLRWYKKFQEYTYLFKTFFSFSVVNKVFLSIY